MAGVVLIFLGASNANDREHPMRKSIALLMLAALLPACGQKGPLYLPPPKPAAGLPTGPAPSSNALADDKKNPAPAK